MAWSDFFLPSSAQTASEQQANFDAQQAAYQAALARRQAAGTLTTQQAQNAADYAASLQLDSQDAAAAQGFVAGLGEGWNNVLNAPGKATGFIGDTLSQTLGGILKNIPWWVYVAGLGALFVYMGGLALLRGRFAKSQ